MRYEIKGGNLPFVVCYLANGESIISESGAMSWHNQYISVETKGRGGLGGMFGRALSGESMFQNIYSAQGGEGEIAFASSFPGSIMAVNISSQNELIVQKKAFLAAESSVQTEMHFQKKIGAGFFGGEGFIMQRFFGNGVAFLEVDGTIEEKVLAHGEKLIVDTGYLLAMEPSCSMDITKAGNLTSMVFGGEGLFNTIVTGPGKVYLQSMPINKLIELIPIPSR